MSCCENCSGLTLLKGTDGVGIASISDNNDGTFTILYTNGNAFTTPNFTGATGSALVGYWKFNTSTAVNPASTFCRFNNASILSISKIYINKTDRDSVLKEDYLNSYYNETTGTSGAIYKYGILTIFQISDINNYVSVEITGITDNTNDIELDIELLSQNAVFTANMELGFIFTPSESILKTITIPFSGWNMDTTNLINIAHNLNDFTKVVEITAMIKNNGASALTPLNTFNGTEVQGGVYQIDTTNVTLERLTGGLFDAVAYNGTGDRGYLTIKYLK